MSQFEYGLGGTERPTDANEAFADLPQNKTLFVQKLTQDDAIKPIITKGLTSVQDVFDHYKPNANLELKGENGEEVTENVQFSNVGDFGPKGVTRNSKHLNGLMQKKAEMNSLVKQLRSNKVLNKALANPDSKAAFIDTLKRLVNEIEENH